MKKILKHKFVILFGCFYLLSSILLAQDLKLKYLLPEGNNLNSVQMVTTDIGYAVGDMGVILKTTDGGLSWDVKLSIFSKLQSVHFINSDIGFVAGYSIIKTIDGGNHWDTIFSPSSILFNKVSFIDANIGYAVGDGVIIKTIDGGKTWASTSYCSNCTLYSVSVLNKDTCYVVGSDIIIKTVDGGINWIKQSVGISATLTSICFPKTDTGYIAGMNGLLFKTVNGGNNWIKQDSISSSSYKSIFFTDVNNGVIVGDNNNIIIKTNDGGNHWTTQLKTNGVNLLHSVSLTNKNSGIIVGDNGTILKTIDNGLNWDTISYVNGNRLTAVNFPTQDTGYILGGGKILKTINAGDVWITDKDGPSNINAFSFRNSQLGYAAGSNGNIYKTTDGGTHWEKLKSGTTNNLKFLSFPSDKIGYVFDDSTVIKTKDGGNSWSQVFCFNKVFNFKSIVFVDTAIGYVYVSPLGLFKTINGGLTWTSLNFKSSTDVSSLYFLNPDTGFVTEQYTGFIYKTTDAGITWNQVYKNYSSGLSSIFFSNDTIGYSVGGFTDLLYSDNIIIKTTNGGVTWIPQKCTANKAFLALCITDSKKCYIVGEDGIYCEISNEGIVISDIKIDNKKDIIIYPNPSTGTFILKDIPIHSSITITNSLGQLISSYNKCESEELLFSIPNCGVYYLSITYDMFSISRIIIITN